MTEADIMSVFGILNLNLDDFFSEDVILFFLTQWPDGQFVATDYRGQIIGALCSARLDPSRASISLLAVDSQYRGCGVGSALMQYFDRVCMINGITVTQLEVRTTNSNAIRFYERKGYGISETLPQFYNDGGSGYRMIRIMGPRFSPS